MLGLMQDSPLLISSLLEYAAQYHGEREIVSRTIEGPIHRYTYREALARSKRLANALLKLGVEPGDRVATLAWNGYRHFELYYAVSGMGAVLHTINPRLFKEQIVYIANHSQAKVLCVDLTFAPLLAAIANELQYVKTFIVMTDRAHMPAVLPNAACYEELLALAKLDFVWPRFDENTASSLCYTSGTTGNPKGVLYSHRSTMLHSFAVCMGDGLGLTSRDVVLPVVPMFHVNSWGIPYAAAMCGAKLVFPGAGLDGASVAELLAKEAVTMTAGVPTVWLMLLNHLREKNVKLPSLQRVVIGGSAAPRAMIEAFEKEFGVRVLHAWGMTEMSPLGTVGNMKPDLFDAPLEAQLPYKLKQGRPIFGVDMKIVDDAGKALPHDGKAFGHLLVRGPWVTKGYYKGEGGQVVDAEDWFDTGDVATIDAQGFMQITDRAKDVIKSGGEWISSIELENLAVGHPAVAEAAVIGIAHPKWNERPLLVVVKKANQEVSKAELLQFMTGKIAKWWLPDDVVFANEIPHTATGKIQKRALRDQLKDYVWPS